MERLTTGRLLLRAFESEDLQSLYAYCSEPDTGIHADKKPHESIEESRQLLNQLMQEDLTWAICDKVSGKNTERCGCGRTTAAGGIKAAAGCWATCSTKDGGDKD